MFYSFNNSSLSTATCNHKVVIILTQSYFPARHLDALSMSRTRDSLGRDSLQDPSSSPVNKTIRSKSFLTSMTPNRTDCRGTHPSCPPLVSSHRPVRPSFPIQSMKVPNSRTLLRVILSIRMRKRQGASVTIRKNPEHLKINGKTS